jgi:hypothetical protein
VSKSFYTKIDKNPKLFVSWFCLSHVWAFLGKESLNTIKYVCKNSMSKTFSKKIDKSFDISFSSIFLVLSRFRVFLSNKNLKILQKTFWQKNRVGRILQKNRQTAKTDFLLIFLIAFLGVSW